MSYSYYEGYTELWFDKINSRSKFCKEDFSEQLAKGVCPLFIMWHSWTRDTLLRFENPFSLMQILQGRFSWTIPKFILKRKFQKMKTHSNSCKFCKEDCWFSKRTFSMIPTLVSQHCQIPKLSWHDTKMGIRDYWILFLQCYTTSVLIVYFLANSTFSI